MVDLPEPLKAEKYEVFRKGISEDLKVRVFINAQRDFAYLDPLPELDYRNYIPRVKRFGLDDYKQSLHLHARRYNKIKHHLANEQQSLLEIGAGDGLFMKTVRGHKPGYHLTAMDKDQNSLPSRVENSDENYDSLEAVIRKNQCFDIICLFHVMEHIQAPLEFLKAVKQVMSADTTLIIEVPSLFDPLLSIYNCDAFSEFYFSRQHPYVFSPPSLQRLMEHGGFQTDELISFQRYGLENHLNWLNHGQPGGHELFRQLFNGLESDYIAALEKNGKTDTVMWIGRKAAK
jgi:SAM-dependent methyltransferase